MSYTALYRKYRPDTFDDVRGQEHVVTTLRNQIIAGRTSHAYLFTGSRGTGKTSVAKIFAKAVNCEHPVNGSPCNECETCRAIASGSSLNAIEIDAASNNGVDSARQIRDEVAYPPPQGRFKVYIIDEAHMLTNQAFNALLKTIEEPPSYLIFILATTEAHKIPVTILSRCQRYDFRRISQEEITARLRQLMDLEGVAASDQALRYIARKAEGGMRDALSLADQCISFYLGQELTYERVLDVLGAVDTQVLGQLFRSIAVGDVADVFARLDDLIFKGRELSQLVSDLTEYLRDLLLIKTTQDADRILDTTAENFALLKEEAALAETGDLLRFIRILSALSGQLRLATAKRTLLEVALIKMCRPAMETDIDSLAARIRSLERLAESGVMFAAGGSGGIPGGSGGNGAAFAGGMGAGQAGGIPGGGIGAASQQSTYEGGMPGAGGAGEGTGAADASGGVSGGSGFAATGFYGGAGTGGTVPARPIYHKAAPEDLRRVEEDWPNIIGMIEGKLDRQALKTSLLKFDAADPAEDVLYVVCRGILGADKLKENQLPELLEELIEQRIGKRIHVRLIDEAKMSAPETGQVFTSVREAAQKRIGIPIEIVPDE